MFGLGGCGMQAQGSVLGEEWGSHGPCLTLNSSRPYSKRDKKESDEEGTEVLLWADSSLGAHLLLPSQSSVWAHPLPKTMSF